MNKVLNAAVESFINQRDVLGVLECWRVGVQDHVRSQGESIPLLRYSNTPDFIREVSWFPTSQQLYLGLSGLDTCQVGGRSLNFAHEQSLFDHTVQHFSSAECGSGEGVAVVLSGFGGEKASGCEEF